MGNFYMVQGLGPGLDGLVVECKGQECVTPDDVVVRGVLRMFDPSVMRGDRVSSVPVNDLGLYIGTHHLVPCEDPSKIQFAHDNPFGTPIVTGSTTRGNLELTSTTFDSGTLTVTIREIDHENEGIPTRTIYSQNFGPPRSERVALILHEFHSGKIEVEDLVFKLKEVENGAEG